MNRSVLSISLLLGALAGVCGAAEPVAVVNGVPLAADRLERALRLQPGVAAQPKGRELALESMIKGEVVVQEARQQHLDQDPEVRAEIEVAEREVLARALLARYLKAHPVTDAQVKARYRESVAKHSGTQYLVRQYAAVSRADALRRTQAINGGHGGDSHVGALWLDAEVLDLEAAKALSALKVGRATQPLGSRAQWRVIELLERRKAPKPTLEQEAPQLRLQLEQEVVQRYIDTLRHNATIKINTK